MNDLFHIIVATFQAICHATGLRYAELNILIYCLLIPFSWALILAIRCKKYFIFSAFHIIAIYLYLSFRGELNIISKQLYDKNITFLTQWGVEDSVEYIKISLILGVLAPLLMYGTLFFFPKTKIVWFYLFFVLVLYGYQLWLWG